jgi:serine/threonine protein phosphatase PrpC
MMQFPSGQAISSFRWIGSQTPYLDRPTLCSRERVMVGCYGGATLAGADKNEDGALVWYANDGSWEFVMLLDGHNSAQSVELVVTTFEAHALSIAALLTQPVETLFTSLHQTLLSIFQSPFFREQCQRIRGETACLICVRKAQFLWWFSVGDCVVYLLHPELARMKQFALNQRQFFEWVGQVNTFDLLVPCYSTGVRELRQGHNQIVMLTDGLLECDTCPFEDPQKVYDAFLQNQRGPETSVQAAALLALQQVHQARGRDSATLITWGYENVAKASLPSQ